MKRLIPLATLLLAGAAIAETNLAVISTKDAIDGSPRSVSTAQKYARPAPTDLVRVLSEGPNKDKWVAFEKLAPTDTIEVCADELPDNTPSVNGNPCTRWPALAVSQVAVAAAAVPEAGSGTAVVSWTAPTQNTDGSTLTDLKGFRIYYGLPTSATRTVDVDKTITSYSFDKLAPGEWFFYLTAISAAGQESQSSNTAKKTIDPPIAEPTVPNPPVVTVADATGYDFVKASNKVTMTAKGMVIKGAKYIDGVWRDPTGTYRLVAVNKTTFKPSSGTTIPQTVFVRQ